MIYLLLHYFTTITYLLARLSCADRLEVEIVLAESHELISVGEESGIESTLAELLAQSEEHVVDHEFAFLHSLEMRPRRRLVLDLLASLLNFQVTAPFNDYKSPTRMASTNCSGDSFSLPVWRVRIPD